MALPSFSRLDYYSLTAVLLDPFFDDTQLSHGTGFFYSFAATTYLVTAWHVLSARNFQDGSNVSATGARPNKIRIWWNLPGMPSGAKIPHTMPILNDEGEPLWLETTSPDGGRVDVAILPVDVPEGCEAYPINEMPEGTAPSGMGSDVFILGFPLREQPLKVPIWKRGSLASEPEIPEALQPYWLVDTASRSGMSGAPVIERSYPHTIPLEDLGRRIANPADNSSSSRFLGVYSGRFRGQEPEDAQLGIVWPLWWILRLIKQHIGDEAYDAELRRPRTALLKV